MRITWSSDVRVYERYWNVIHRDEGDLVMVIGGSFYPNLDAAEAFAIVNLAGDHRSVRAFRPLGHDRMELGVGPIQPTIVEGLRTWRHILEPNEWGISYDLTFRDDFRQEFRERRTHPTGAWPPGRRPDVTSGFEGFGSVEGWLRVDDRHIELDFRTCRGTRDRHWGLGRDVGGPGLQVPDAPSTHGVSGNTFVSFETWGLWGDSVLYPIGHESSRADRVRRITRRLRFDEPNHHFVGGIVDFDLASGDVKRLHFRRREHQTAYMRCGMYGGTPDGGTHQGERRSVHVEGDRYDVRDETVCRLLGGLDEHLCEVTCDGKTVLGIYQPIDPAAYEACRSGLAGWNLLEDDSDLLD